VEIAKGVLFQILNFFPTELGSETKAEVEMEKHPSSASAQAAAFKEINYQENLLN